MVQIPTSAKLYLLIVAPAAAAAENTFEQENKTCDFNKVCKYFIQTYFFDAPQVIFRIWLQ